MQAFVLSGGGNRGGLQAGALLALIERGIKPQLIVGTSVGAINSVALAADPTRTGIERVVRSWQNVRRTDVFPGNPFTVGWRILTGQGSLHDQRNFQHFIRGMTPTGIKYFADLHIPCIVTATKLGSGELHLFGIDRQDLLMDALMSSTAVPPFFAPYRYKGEWLIDGAVVANLPLVPALERGAQTIYVLEIIEEHQPAGTYGLLQTLSSAFRAMLHRQHAMEHRIAALKRRGITIHTIKLATDPDLAYDNFRMTAIQVTKGYEITARYLDEQVSSTSSTTHIVTNIVRTLLSQYRNRKPSVPTPSRSTST